MPCTRHIIVCEGESEWAYLQRLQSFLDQQPLADGTFEPPLRFIAPERVIVKNGTFGKLKSRYNKTRRENKKASIQIWGDFDLYHRNDTSCADHYAQKTPGIPDFLFSFHNFEDFFALHWEGESFQAWLSFGNKGHFTTPLHSDGYLPEIKKIFPDYSKGELPADFITWNSLKNLKLNKVHQPTSNPHDLQGLGKFADFLIGEIGKAYPGVLQ
jgi:hypothetical protein